MINRTLSLSLVSTAALLAGTQGAFALDADDFGTKLAAAGKLMGVSFHYESATAEGDTVTLSNFTIAVPEDDDDIELPGDLVFEGVTEMGDGGYTADTATIADVEVEDEDMTFRFENILAENLEIPASATISDAIDISFSLYDRVSAGPLTISIDGEEVFSIAVMSTWVEDEAEDGGLGTGYEVTGLTGDLSNIEDSEAREFIDAFGVEQISGSLRGYGVWHPEDGTAEVEEMRITLADLGSLNVTAAVSGYTVDIYNEMMKVNLKMAELAEMDEELSDEDMERIETEMLEQMAALKLERASIRYEDNSLFNKALDFGAAMQGMNPAMAKLGIKAGAPLALIEFGLDAEKIDAISAALNTFVDDPQSLEITAEPDSPVGIEAFEAAESNPLSLLDTLNVDIRANE